MGSPEGYYAQDIINYLLSAGVENNTGEISNEHPMEYFEYWDSVLVNGVEYLLAATPSRESLALYKVI